MPKFLGDGAGRKTTVLATILALAMALPALGAAGDPSIAKAVAVRPEATSLLGGNSAVILAEDDLFEGQKIVTGAQGQVQIVFADDTHLVVGPGSSLVIEKYLMRNGGTASSFAVSALGGTFRFITGKSPKSAYSIVTPTATIGVRGTKFDFSVDGDTKETKVVLFEGEVKLCPKSGGCETVKDKCDVGFSETSNADLIKSSDSKHASATANFPYVASQSSLQSSFKVSSASGCGGQAPAAVKTEKPKAEPAPDKPKPDPKPIPDPKPDGN